ncbi:hypothetical protein DW690_07365 [Dorea longicatena]|nr:hypothetical protein DW690_07365 [Dorea longicatena]
MGYPVSAGRGIRPFGKVHGVGPGRYMGSVREGTWGRSGKVHGVGPGRYIRSVREGTSGQPRKGHPIGPGRGPSRKFGQ